MWHAFSSVSNSPNHRSPWVTLYGHFQLDLQKLIISCKQSDILYIKTNICTPLHLNRFIFLPFLHIMYGLSLTRLIVI